MIETIKFDLTASMAIIKKPDSNETYYTYDFPHKIMLLGLLGAIIGLNGYNYYAWKKFLGQEVENMPEFYEKLHPLKIAIIPKIKRKNFNRKIQTFNNSVGYASDEKGNNLVVKEQWLEKPYWQIYILQSDIPEYEKIKSYLSCQKCEYIPYIGKNDHFAQIKNVEIFQAQETLFANQIDSLFEKTIIKEIEDKLDDLVAFMQEENIQEEEYEYQELLPTKLSEKIGYYDFKSFLFTNKKIQLQTSQPLYQIKNKIVYYF